jgi:hypothetical protein
MAFSAQKRSRAFAFLRFLHVFIRIFMKHALRSSKAKFDLKFGLFAPSVRGQRP